MEIINCTVKRAAIPLAGRHRLRKHRDCSHLQQKRSLPVYLALPSFAALVAKNTLVASTVERGSYESFSPVFDTCDCYTMLKDSIQFDGLNTVLAWIAHIGGQVLEDPVDISVCESLR